MIELTACGPSIIAAVYLEIQRRAVIGKLSAEKKEYR